MPKNLPGKRVLVVEDNPMLAYDLRDIMSERGAEIIGPALDLSTGLQLARENQLDGALLDVDLGGELVWPLARELQEHTVPFIFISADCKDSDLPQDFRQYRCLDKPARSADILQTISGLMSGTAEAPDTRH